MQWMKLVRIEPSGDGRVRKIWSKNAVQGKTSQDVGQDSAAKGFSRMLEMSFGEEYSLDGFLFFSYMLDTPRAIGSS